MDAFDDLDPNPNPTVTSHEAQALAALGAQIGAVLRAHGTPDLHVFHARVTLEVDDVTHDRIAASVRPPGFIVSTRWGARDEIDLLGIDGALRVQVQKASQRSREPDPGWERRVWSAIEEERTRDPRTSRGSRIRSALGRIFQALRG